MNGKKTLKNMAYSGFLVLILISVDQLTKWLAYKNLFGKPGVYVIPGVFQLKYLENDSAAFSLDPVSLLQKIFHFSYFETHPAAFLTAKMAFLVILTVAVLIIIAILYQKIPCSRRFFPLNLIAIGIYAGAIGNLIDRVARHYVIDFLYFSLIDFPIFNVADIYVTVAAIALIVVVLFYYKEDDFSGIFEKKKQKES